MFIRVLSILALSFPVAAATPPRVIINASATGPARYIVALDDEDDAVSDALIQMHHGRALRTVHAFVADMSPAEAASLLLTFTDTPVLQHFSTQRFNSRAPRD